MKLRKIFLLLLICIIFISGCNSKKEVKKEKKNKDNEITSSIFKDYYTDASKLVDSMSIEDKIAQLFIVAYDKVYPTWYSKNSPAGYLLFAKDFKDHTKEEMKNELDSANSKSKYPLIFAADEEGGYVTRISRYPEYRNEKFLSPKDYYDKGGFSLLESTEKEKAKLLKSIGVNLNLAPVADVSQNENDFIYIRTLGRNAEDTSEIIKKMVEYANDEKISSCLKHFPGYGNNLDTHTGVAIDERSYENFVNNDYLPFKAGIDAKVPCILVSHNIVKSIDPENPSSLSSKVISELRDKLGLAMDAVKEYVENNEAATKAINAGNDLIITSDFKNMYEEVLNSYKEGKIKEETINKAVLRIMAWKYYFNLF